MKRYREPRGSLKTSFRIAGGVIAWVMGSGYATGQEVLQFYSAFGLKSFGVLAITMGTFMLFGYLLMRNGFRMEDEPEISHFERYCGPRLGRVYDRLLTVSLLALIPVLISGGGATLQEYYGVPKPLGSALMAAAALAAYLAGFEKLVNVTSKLGPAIIAFSLTVGAVSVIRGAGNFGRIPEFDSLFAPYRAAPTWWFSALLYTGLNFCTGSAYFTRLGGTAECEREIRRGAILGGGALILSVAMMSSSILLYGDRTAGLDIPALFLARQIAPFFGAVFSVTLVLGIFSSCSLMMWTVCGKAAGGEGPRNRLVAAGVALGGYVLSLFPFVRLVGSVFPLIGYVGLPFLVMVLWKEIGRRKK